MALEERAEMARPVNIARKAMRRHAPGSIRRPSAAFITRSLFEFGGPLGVRDPGALESTLAGPHHLFAYGNPDLCDLAAAYPSGLCQNHGFVNGNKRTAFLTAFVFIVRERLYHSSRTGGDRGGGTVIGRPYSRPGWVRSLIAGAHRAQRLVSDLPFSCLVMKCRGPATSTSGGIWPRASRWSKKDLDNARDPRLFGNGTRGSGWRNCCPHETDRVVQSRRYV